MTTMTPRAAAATQRALDAALQPLPLTPLPEVYEWHGQPGRDAFDAANRELLARAHGAASPRRFVAGAALALASLTAHAGMDMNDSWTGPDKARHQAIGAIAGFAVQQYTGSVWKGIAAGFVLGAAKEYADSRNPAAHSVSLQDMLMTTAGAAVGAGFGRLVVRYGQGRTTIQYGAEF